LDYPSCARVLFLVLGKCSQHEQLKGVLWPEPQD